MAVPPRIAGRSDVSLETGLALACAAVAVITLPTAIFLRVSAEKRAHRRAIEQKPGTALWTFACHHRLFWYTGLIYTALLVIAVSEIKLDWLKDSIGVLWGALLVNLLAAALLGLVKAPHWHRECRVDSLRAAFANYPERRQRLNNYLTELLSNDADVRKNALKAVVKAEEPAVVYPAETP